MSSSSHCFSCPACNAQVANLDRLNFHLSFACSSRPCPSNKKQQREESIVCPGCEWEVKRSELNFHLDTLCASKSSPILTVPTAVARLCAEPRPPGLLLLEDFLSLEEESSLLQNLRNERWVYSTRNGQSLSQTWGVEIDYSGSRPRPIWGKRPMPAFLDFIVHRFRKHACLAAWTPNNCNAMLYTKSGGDMLTPHYDDRRLGGEIVCNVNLLSDCFMTFKRASSTFKVRLPRLSASVMSRSARYEYTHEIVNGDILGEQRISLNFRQQSTPS